MLLEFDSVVGTGSCPRAATCDDQAPNEAEDEELADTSRREAERVNGGTPTARSEGRQECVFKIVEVFRLVRMPESASGREVSPDACPDEEWTTTDGRTGREIVGDENLRGAVSEPASVVVPSHRSRGEATGYSEDSQCSPEQGRWMPRQHA